MNDKHGSRDGRDMAGCGLLTNNIPCLMDKAQIFLQSTPRLPHGSVPAFSVYHPHALHPKSLWFLQALTAPALTGLASLLGMPISAL